MLTVGRAVAGRGRQRRRKTGAAGQLLQPNYDLQAALRLVAEAVEESEADEIRAPAKQPPAPVVQKASTQMRQPTGWLHQAWRKRFNSAAAQLLAPACQLHVVVQRCRFTFVLWPGRILHVADCARYSWAVDALTGMHHMQGLSKDFYSRAFLAAWYIIMFIWAWTPGLIPW